MKILASVVGWLTLGSFAFVCIGSIFSFSATPAHGAPSVKVTELDTPGEDYLQLLGGPPESVSTQSGLVVLAPQQSVWIHSTHQHEELVVVLEGKGEMILKDKAALPVQNASLRVGYDVNITQHGGTGILDVVFGLRRTTG
jgi:hypothetical protein